MLAELGRPREEQERLHVLTHGALIHIFCAVSPFVALWAGANVLPVQRVGVTQCPLVAWIADACVIQVT